MLPLDNGGSLIFNARNMNLNFNDMLQSQGIDPEKVIAFRHRPKEKELMRALAWLAEDRHDLFNAYQQTQKSDRVESSVNSLVGKGYLASFIGQEACRATFVGLYKIRSTTPWTREEFQNNSTYQELRKIAGGAKSWFTEEMQVTRPTIRFFDFTLDDFYSHWKGRLVVQWPPPERSWWRRAHKNDLTIHAIHETSVFQSEMPPWNRLILRWEELSILPTLWKERMSQWRGIYCIFDTSDGMRYVGSAYGASNIWGRWMTYGSTGHGGNKLLRGRNPTNFQFSILERVSPDMEVADVVALETSWKERLHTYAPEGLNEN